MSDKDLRGQLEGLFSDIVSEPGAEEEKPLPEEAILSLAEAETAGAEVVEGESVEPLPPTPAKPEEAEGERREIPLTSALDWKTRLGEQRTRILNILLVGVTGIGTIAIGGLLIGLVQRPDRLGAYIPYFVAYGVLVGLILARRLDPALRATVLIIVAYVVGISSLLRNGPLGTGALYLLMAPLLFSILVRQRAGLIALGVSIAIYIAFVIAYYQGWLKPAAVFDLTQLYFVLILSGTFAMIAVGVILIQRMFSSSLASALQEAEARHIELVRYQRLLEERADELTAANTLLRKLTLQLQTAAQISQAATAELDPDALVQQAVDLIHERFALYYVGLFLADESGQWAVLQAGTGEAGRQMLEQGHRLKVGGGSMVGWCMAHGQARMALEADEESIRFDSPLLLEARSKVALPLISRGRVIGALDVRSVEEEAFSQADITVLRTMADQLAVAVDNAQLFTKTQTTLEEMEESQRRYLRQQWAELVPARVAPSYERTRSDVPPLGDVVLPEVEQAMVQREMVVQSGTGDGSEQAALVVPISLRGVVIGALGLHETDTKRQWTDEEIALIEAVADQMALAIENARLFEQTQRYASRDRLLADITARVRSSMDPQTILQIAVRELGAAMGTDRAFVRLGQATPAQSVTPGVKGQEASSRKKSSEDGDDPAENVRGDALGESPAG